METSGKVNVGGSWQFWKMPVKKCMNLLSNLIHTRILKTQAHLKNKHMKLLGG